MPSTLQCSVSAKRLLCVTSLTICAACVAPSPDSVPPSLADVADGHIRVMSANALNLFSTVDAGDNRCGPDADACRGADSAAEFTRQLAKLVTTVRLSDADVVALMEVENDAGETLTALAEAVSRATGDAWRSVNTGVVGRGPIKVGFVYNAARVRAPGRPSILDGRIDSRFNDDKNRPSVAQVFVALGEPDTAGITVVANHFKSKGSNCDELGDPDLGDGQGNCNLTRTRAAAALADWVATDPLDTDGDVLLVGDLNAYLGEDPVMELETSGYVNLLTRFIGSDAWTYVYRGRRGALDHAFATAKLAERIADVVTWHINAGQDRDLDYNLDNDRDPLLFDAASPVRSSDHDPLIVDIRARH